MFSLFFQFPENVKEETVLCKLYNLVLNLEIVVVLLPFYFFFSSPFGFFGFGGFCGSFFVVLFFPQDQMNFCNGHKSLRWWPPQAKNAMQFPEVRDTSSVLAPLPAWPANSSAFTTALMLLFEGVIRNSMTHKPTYMNRPLYFFRRHILRSLNLCLDLTFPCGQVSPIYSDF